MLSNLDRVPNLNARLFLKRLLSDVQGFLPGRTTAMGRRVLNGSEVGVGATMGGKQFHNWLARKSG